MLVNNFSAGILGGVMAVVAHLTIGPVVESMAGALGDAVGFLVDKRLLPLADLLIEPGKVLFLNNAINHGVLTPLGVAEVIKSGKAIHFLLQSHPVPGFGLLGAFWLMSKGTARQSAPGSIFAELAMTPKGAHFGVLGGIFLGALEAFIVGTFLLKISPVPEPKK